MGKRLGDRGWRKRTHQCCSVQFSSVAQLCLTLCNPMICSTPGLPVHHQLLESDQTHVHRVGDAIQPSHPLSPLLLLPPIPPSIRVVSNESTLRMRWPKYWSFSFSIIPSKEQEAIFSFYFEQCIFYNFIFLKYSWFKCCVSFWSSAKRFSCPCA